MRYLFSAVLALALSGAWLRLGASPQPEAPRRLRLGLLRTGDSFPLFYAKQQGYYAAEGLEVEVVDFLSAMERDAALQAGAIDMANGDMVGASLMAQAHHNIKVVALTLGDRSHIRRVGIITRDPLVKTPKDLAGKSLAISRNTIIEYLSDRLLAKHGVELAKVDQVNVVNVAQRLELLNQGRFAAAVLPEPLASLAIAGGGRMLVGDDEDSYSHALVVASTRILGEQPVVARKMLLALQRAIKEINANRERFRPAIAARCRVPEAVKDSFFIYEYVEGDVPSLLLHKDVQAWLLAKGRIKTEISYESLIDGQYLPRTNADRS